MEGTRRLTSDCRHGVEGPLSCRATGYALQELLIRFSRSFLQRHRLAVLALSARALHVHHETARNTRCERRAVVVLDQRKCQIDAGGHAGGCADESIADGVEFGVGIVDGYLRSQ